MSAFKTSPLLLLILTLLIVWSPITSARRIPKGGCLNYGHSCLGAHGKRASWHPDVQLPAPTNQPSLSRPLLNILLEALDAHPAPLATLRHTKDETTQGRDDFLRELSYNNEQNANSRSIQDGDIVSGFMVPDALVGLLSNQMNARDLRMGDRLDDKSEWRDASYFNMEDYTDDRIRRSAIGKASATKDGKKDGNQEWETEGKEKNLHKGKDFDIRQFANWLRR